MTAPGFTEFQYDPTLKKTWHDTCGEYGIEFAIAKAEGRKATPGDMLALTHDMLAHHEHSGGTNPHGLLDEIHRRGHQAQLVEGVSDAEYHKLLLENAGKKPIVFMFELAQNLMDCETGIGYSFRTPFKRTGQGLHGHYIYVDHAQHDGYVCADGANPQATQRWAVYRWDTLASSQIVAMLILEHQAPTPEPKPVPAPAPVPAPKPESLPAPKPEVSAELTSLIADLGNLLNPFIALARDLDALKRKLGL